MAVNPQGGVGNSCQVSFPISNPQLGGSWGERGFQPGTTLRSRHRDVRAAKGLEGAEPRVQAPMEPREGV